MCLNLYCQQGKITESTQVDRNLLKILQRTGKNNGVKIVDKNVPESLPLAGKNNRTYIRLNLEAGKIMRSIVEDMLLHFLQRAEENNGVYGRG